MRYLLLFGGICAMVGGVILLSLLVDMHRCLVQAHLDTDMPWWGWSIYYVLLFGVAQLIRVGLVAFFDSFRPEPNPEEKP